MGLLIFLVLKGLKILDTPWDSYWACLLLSIELPQWSLMWCYLRRPR